MVISRFRIAEVRQKERAWHSLPGPFNLNLITIAGKKTCVDMQIYKF